MGGLRTIAKTSIEIVKNCQIFCFQYAGNLCQNVLVNNKIQPGKSILRLYMRYMSPKATTASMEDNVPTSPFLSRTRRSSLALRYMHRPQPHSTPYLPHQQSPCFGKFPTLPEISARNLLFGHMLSFTGSVHRTRHCYKTKKAEHQKIQLCQARIYSTQNAVSRHKRQSRILQKVAVICQMLGRAESPMFHISPS